MMWLVVGCSVGSARNRYAKLTHGIVESPEKSSLDAFTMHIAHMADMMMI